jgi:hypothetical protein
MENTNKSMSPTGTRKKSSAGESPPGKSSTNVGASVLARRRSTLALEKADLRMRYRFSMQNTTTKQQQEGNAGRGGDREETELVEDLHMLGLYRLTEDQTELYMKFADLLSQFDPYEMDRILHDLRKDAEAMTLLENYGGTHPADRGR